AGRSALSRHAIEIAVGDQLESHRDEAVVDLPLALQLYFVDVLLGQRVLHLPEAIVVQLGGVDMAADQFRRVRLAQPERARNGAIGMIGVVDGYVNALIHFGGFLLSIGGLRPPNPLTRSLAALARALRFRRRDLV